MIRRTVFLALVLLLGCSACFAADWYEVAKLKGGDAVSVRTTDITVDKGILTFYTKLDTQTPFGNGAKTIISKYVYNIDGAYGRRAEDVYVLDDGSTQTAKGSDWQDVSPASVAGEEIRSALRLFLEDAEWTKLTDTYAVTLKGAAKFKDYYWLWTRMEADGKFTYFANCYFRNGNFIKVSASFSVDKGDDNRGVLVNIQKRYPYQEGSLLAQAAAVVVKHFD